MGTYLVLFNCNTKCHQFSDNLNPMNPVQRTPTRQVCLRFLASLSLFQGEFTEVPSKPERRIIFTSSLTSMLLDSQACFADQERVMTETNSRMAVQCFMLPCIYFKFSSSPLHSLSGFTAALQYTKAQDNQMRLGISTKIPENRLKNQEFCSARQLEIIVNSSNCLRSESYKKSLYRRLALTTGIRILALKFFFHH